VSLPPSSRRSSGRPRLQARWIAGLLALLLGAALASVGAVAGAQQAPGTDPPEAGAPETSAPDTTAPETSAPDTTAPDTSAPDSSAPDTSAPDTSAPDTTAPDQGAAENDANGNINNLPENDGVQRGTVFNPVPYGEIPADAPQVVILRPGSGRILPLNRELNIRVRFANFEPGAFSDPASGYGLGPQRLNGAGHLQGHNHACFQRIAANGAVPPDPCDSFVVLERDGDTDILTGIAPPLTRAGRYRLCADAASEFHYVGARAFAREGGSTDCVRVLIMDLAQLRNR
jgi:hypothetical protein